MLDGLESGQGLAYNLVFDTCSLCCQGRCHGVVDIVLSAKSELLEEEVGLFLFIADVDLLALKESALLQFLLLGERKHLAAEDYLVKMADGDGIVRVEDEAVVRTQVPGDVELRCHIVLDIVVVAVEMVWGDVGDDGDVRAEIVNVVKLETGDFQDVVVEMLGRYLIRIGFADVSAKAHVEACVLHQVID